MWRPQFWPGWLMCLVWRALAALPFRARLATGTLLGRVLYLVGGRRLAIARTNLELCLPEISAAERETLLKAHCAELGIGVLEMGAAYWQDDTALGPIRLVGLEHLDAAREGGRGVLLLGAHFLPSEIVMRELLRHHRLNPVYRPNNNPIIEAAIDGGRRRHAEDLVDRADIRHMLRVLKEGRILWTAPDQDHGPRHSVFVPFFGQTAATVTTPARLARMTGAALVPCFPHRLPGAAGYELVIEPALEGIPSDDAEADAAHVNAVIERHVRRSPAQYLWVHRRFKTRPDGEASLYPAKRKRS